MRSNFFASPLEGFMTKAYLQDTQVKNVTCSNVILFIWRKNMSFRPLHDRVVVKRIDAQEKTKGGIIIPDTAKEKPQEGEVVAVGPGARDDHGKLTPLDLKVGDHILFGKWSGTEIKIDGQDLLVMKESDVIGIIENKSAKKAA